MLDGVISPRGNVVVKQPANRPATTACAEPDAAIRVRKKAVRVFVSGYVRSTRGVLARESRESGLSNLRFTSRLLVLKQAKPGIYVPMTEYVAAPQADTLSHPLSCASDGHP